MPRQAGSCLSSQTLGITVSVAMFVIPLSLRSLLLCRWLLVPLRRLQQSGLCLRFASSGVCSFQAALVLPLHCEAQGVASVSAGAGRAARQCVVQSKNAPRRPVSRRRLAGSYLSAFAGRLAVMGSTFSVGVSGHKVARQRAMPNPSIERTCPGKPGHASHLKRYTPR
jgi:hypothetical protein